MKPTPVIFRIWPDTRTVLALFPCAPGTNDVSTCSYYERVGQHGSADLTGCVRRTRPAKRAEWQPLARELRAVGYRLRVVKRTPANAYAQRKAQIYPATPKFNDQNKHTT